LAAALADDLAPGTQTLAQTVHRRADVVLAAVDSQNVEFFGAHHRLGCRETSFERPVREKFKTPLCAKWPSGESPPGEASAL
jgi:hypothetical protein